MGSFFRNTTGVPTVEDVVRLLGGPDAAANRCGVGTEAVRKWRQAQALSLIHI